MNGGEPGGDDLQRVGDGDTGAFEAVVYGNYSGHFNSCSSSWFMAHGSSSTNHELSIMNR